MRARNDLIGSLSETLLGIRGKGLTEDLVITLIRRRAHSIQVSRPRIFTRARMALLPEEFDAVITNPPYTRQEEMEYKEKIREIALKYSDGSEIEMSGRAGIYAYFFTHSAKFLKAGFKSTEIKLILKARAIETMERSMELCKS